MFGIRNDEETGENVDNAVSACYMLPADAAGVELERMKRAKARRLHHLPLQIWRRD